ncbi:MAG: DUF6882 domain-containing protein [Terricaulis sp.]
MDVDRYWAEAWVDLHRRQTLLANKLKLGKANWTVNQEAGLIEFDRADGKLVTAPVQIIGSWNPRTTAFTWGWDHPSVQTRLRADAERTRWFGDKHDLPELTEQPQDFRTGSLASHGCRDESERRGWRLSRPHRRPGRIHDARCAQSDRLSASSEARIHSKTQTPAALFDAGQRFVDRFHRFEFKR